jgi:hypothetical protein
VVDKIWLDVLWAQDAFVLQAASSQFEQHTHREATDRRVRDHLGNMSVVDHAQRFDLNDYFFRPQKPGYIHFQNPLKALHRQLFFAPY